RKWNVFGKMQSSRRTGNTFTLLRARLSHSAIENSFSTHLELTEFFDSKTSMLPEERIPSDIFLVRLSPGFISHSEYQTSRPFLIRSPASFSANGRSLWECEMNTLRIL